MATALQDLVDKRATTWAKAQEFDTRKKAGDEMSAEDEAAWERALDDVDSLELQIKNMKRSDTYAGQFAPVDEAARSAGADGGRPAPAGDHDADYRSAFTAFMRGGAGRLDRDQQGILEGRGVDAELRAQSVGTGSAGGYLVPPGYRDEFIKIMKDYGAVQRVAQVITTDTGANLQWPTMDDTGNVGAILAENTQMSEQDIALTSASLDAYLYYSKLTRVSVQLAQDAAFDVEATVKAAHAERIARIQNQHFTTGTGTSQPDGLVTSAVSGVTAAGVAAITGDELISLQHSVDPAYRNSERVRWMLSDVALAAVRKLKSSDNQYLWAPGLTAGVDDTLLGKPYEVNTDMAVPATGVKSVLFGDFFAGYVIRIVKGIQVVTFGERYMDYLQIGHASYMRADGTQQNAKAYKALTQA